MSLLPFKPKIGPDEVNTPHNYDYVPSVVNNRIFWCCGLGTDTIVSANLALPASTTFPKPFVRAYKLVCDPAAIKTPSGFTVYHTVGNPDGRQNGIGWFKTDQAGNPKTGGMLIAQAGNPSTYGIGQPSVCAVPGNRFVMFVRTDGEYWQANALEAFEIDSATGIRIIRRLVFNRPEDGVSPEIFFHDGKIFILLTAVDAEGNGWVGIRSYLYNQNRGTLIREYEKEQSFPISGGNFWARVAKPITHGIDGSGVVRDNVNSPVITNDRIAFWRGWRDSLTKSNDWKLVRDTIGLPHG